MNDVVFADPQNKAARNLEADALEQLGYQSEAATWRNEYLVGVMELRSGVPAVPPNGLNPDMLKAIPLDLLFDFMGIHVNPAKAEGKKLTLNCNFPDTNQNVLTNLHN